MATGGVGTDPDSDTDDSTSPFALFPESKAYALTFHFPSDKVLSVYTDEETVVVVDSDEKRAKLDSINTISKITEGYVDHKTRVIILSFKGTLPKNAENCWKKWMEDVKEKLNQEIGTALYKVIHTGPGAELWKLQVAAKFSSTKVSCTTSENNESLLLISKDRRSLVKARIALDSGGEFVTPSKQLRVLVFSSDISKLKVEAIVSAADGKLSCSGGVSRVIATAAGDVLVEELRELQEKGSARVTEVVVTTGGNLHCKKVLHAVGPQMKDYATQSRCHDLLTDTVYNCLVTASEMGLTSIAIPAISSGKSEVPRAVCAMSYKEAVKRFDERAGKTSLQHIHFVDTNESMIGLIRQEFQELQVGSQQEEEAEELRIVLVGKMGAGKSALGNSILKEKDVFTSEQAFVAVTEKSDAATKTMTFRDSNIKVRVVDTPGVVETGETLHGGNEDIQKEVIRSLYLLLPGPHIILVVFRADRFSETEASIYERIAQLFPGLLRYMMVVFTNVDSEEELAKLLKRIPACMERLIRDCAERVAAINNRGVNRDEQVDELMEKILVMYKDNRHQYYSNEIISSCRQHLLSTDHANKTWAQIRQEVLDWKLDKVSKKPLPEGPGNSTCKYL